MADKWELRQFKETPEQRFALEQEHLQPLPDTDFDTSYFDIRHIVPGPAITKLEVISTAFPKCCVVSQSRYEYR